MHTHDRLNSLDAVRACALLAGIILHAIMSLSAGFSRSQLAAFR